MEKEKIQIRDKRKKHWLWMHYDMLEYIAKATGPSCLMVYAWLCYYVDWDGQSEECWPKIETLVQKTGLSEKTVRDSLVELQKFKIINIRRTGRAGVYTLLDSPSKEFIEKVVLNDLSRQLDKAQTRKNDPQKTPPLIGKNYLSDRQKTTPPINDQNPSTKTHLPSKKEASPQLKDAFQKVVSKGVNIYQLIAKFKQDEKMEGDLPEDMLIRICDRFIEDKPEIRSVWGWFKRVLQRELQLHKHELIKKDTNCVAVSLILKQMSVSG